MKSERNKTIKKGIKENNLTDMPERKRIKKKENQKKTRKNNKQHMKRNKTIKKE